MWLMGPVVISTVLAWREGPSLHGRAVGRIRAVMAPWLPSTHGLEAVVFGMSGLVPAFEISLVTVLPSRAGTGVMFWAFSSPARSVPAFTALRVILPRRIGITVLSYLLGSVLRGILGELGPDFWCQRCQGERYGCIQVSVLLLGFVSSAGGVRRFGVMGV